MKLILQNLSYLKLILLVAAVVALHICKINPVAGAEQRSFNEKKRVFIENISKIAERFIGTPYKFGGDFTSSWAIDNSHLLCTIYDEAAQRAGFNFKGYMPMKELLRNTVKIERNDLRIGDLIVLNDGHAALIYKFENRNKFFMVYASLKRNEVISFNSQTVVYEAYWLKNLGGFYRLSDEVLIPFD